MNEQSGLPLGVPATSVSVIEPTMSDRADRIRSLVGVARHCIIEIGRELIEAKDSPECKHGRWLPWLHEEFGWPERTAQDYMRVAKVFGQMRDSRAFESLTIDATALYALAAPDVPQAARDEAVERAEAGEVITKTEAEKIIIAAEKEMKKQLREALAEHRDAAAAKLAEHRETAATKLEKAQEKYAKNIDKLTAEIARIKTEKKEPDVAQAVALFCKILKKPKLTPKQLQLIAQVLDTPVTDGRRTYPPVSEETSKQAEENLRVCSAAERAIEYFAAAPTPETVLAAALPVQRNNLGRRVGPAIEWLKALQSAMENETT